MPNIFLSHKRLKVADCIMLACIPVTGCGAAADLKQMRRDPAQGPPD
jgi:hypothetical protein